MKRPNFLRLTLAGALLAATTPAIAQSPLCQQYRAELAALDRGSGRPAAAAAERQRAEIARLTSYYRSIGCERGPLTFLSGPAPAECGSIGQRIRQLEASYGSLAAQADQTPGGEARRRQLVAAIDQTCNAPQQEAAGGARGFLESLFGPPSSGRPVPPPGGGQGAAPENPDGTPLAPGEEGTGPLGGRRLACVRTCDGFFFPLANAPGGRENADDMCQALCPGTETLAFAMPSSDDAISRAISLRGRPYTALPTAFKFQKSFDESCSCKKDGENWSNLLLRAESMLDQRKGDMIVTAQRAEELSRPKAIPVQLKKPDPKADQKPDAKATEAEDKAAAEIGAAAPTASQESSGIGPKSIDATRVIPKSEGVRRDVTDPDGKKKSVRVIAPNVIPVPDAKKP
jgi:hypothetical protein